MHCIRKSLLAIDRGEKPAIETQAIINEKTATSPTLDRTFNTPYKQCTSGYRNSYFLTNITYLNNTDTLQGTFIPTKPPSKGYNNLQKDETLSECTLQISQIQVMRQPGESYYYTLFSEKDTFQKFQTDRITKNDYITNLFQVTKSPHGNILAELYQE